MLLLSDLKEGEKGIIAKVKGRGAFRRRIMEMGFVPGKQVIVVKHAPLMDPVEYNIMGYEVSLRRAEASMIELFTAENLPLENGQSFYGVKVLEGALSIDKLPGHRHINVALVGNPNSGKTTLFNIASNSHERVANYSGVTVDAKSAVFEHKGYRFELTDLPGTYSITSYSPEELYVRNFIFDQLPDVVINVVDASNLERNLYLTTQLIDMDIKVVMALNMFDELKKKGHDFDYEHLAKMIGIPIVPTIATKGKGIEELFDWVADVFEDLNPLMRSIHINYGPEIELSIERLQATLQREGNERLYRGVAPRFIAIKLLENDSAEWERASGCSNAQEIQLTAKNEQKRIESIFKNDPESVITDAKYGFVEGALRETFRQATEQPTNKSREIDRLLTHRFWSYPVFLLVMWAIFQSTFWLGSYPMNWIEQGVTALGALLSDILPKGMLHDLIIDGVIGGVGGVIVFLPNILILFFFLSLLETTGYMARVAFIVDKIMHRVGLHGRSFIPLLMGFGCNVPAIMATRTIENRSDRLITMMIIPFMSCSARYPVYILIIGAFFTEWQGTILFGIYLTGIFFAVALAILFKKTLFKTQEFPFVMELPPYRLPTAKSVFRQTWFKGRHYLKKMGSIILIASLVIWALGYFPMGKEIDEQIDQQIESIKAQNALQPNPDAETSITQLEYQRKLLKQENSLIGRIGHWLEPAIQPLGFDWKMGVSLLAGSAAKEVIISTMGVLYQTEAHEDEIEGLAKKLQEQRYDSGPKASQTVYRPLTALSFMLFILIYFPCIAVFAAIKKESGAWKWPLFTSVYTTLLAWLVAFAVYQTGLLLGF